MKLLSLTVVCLPVVSANYTWWTKGGWAKPADFNTKECAGNPNTQYFCGTLSGTRGENPEPNSFPWRRYTCALADTQGRGCHWQGAVGSLSVFVLRVLRR
ncbi:hypothetical protein FPRO05_05629 [Fusarium proliferatum]|uniref:Uncharacterized protein n=1 Tax=Gibberella intermedia TaxID=948311 RepID=A0A365MMA6_GIBIN|nr:hypothetical protein FPRO05_05629 [Fusarium proliferatum]